MSKKMAAPEDSKSPLDNEAWLKLFADLTGEDEGHTDSSQKSVLISDLKTRIREQSDRQLVRDYGITRAQYRRLQSDVSQFLKKSFLQSTSGLAERGLD